MNFSPIKNAPQWTVAPIKHRVIAVCVFIIIATIPFFTSHQSRVGEMIIKQRSGTKTGTNNDKNKYTPSLDSFRFDPSHLQSKHHLDVEGLQPDGTYFLYRDNNMLGPNEDCTPLLSEGDKIKQIHYHHNTCKYFDRQFGNRVATNYGMKMMADAMQIPFKFTCGINKDIGPNGAEYLMALNDLDGIGHPPVRDGVELTAEEVCRDVCRGSFCTWHSGDLYLEADSMMYDWRYLTSPALVTVKDHDDAVIHLRLGDGLYSTLGENEFKGVFPHATYVNLLMEAQQERGTIKSIGIATAPFKGKHLRAWDLGYTLLSEMVANDLVEALQRAFPQATVTIHNNQDETIMQSLSRIANAKKVAVCGCSTFCPYPLMATRGIGYVYNPVGEQNLWVRKAAELYENIRLFETPMLNGLMISNEKTNWRLKDEEVLRWMKTQDASIGNVDIVDHPLYRSALA